MKLWITLALWVTLLMFTGCVNSDKSVTVVINNYPAESGDAPGTIEVTQNVTNTSETEASENAVDGEAELSATGF